MSKWGTFGHILEGIGLGLDPRIGQAIDAGKAIRDAKTDPERLSAILTEIEASLSLAGDLSGKEALQDPAMRALIEKYVRDGAELHDYIEAHKANAQKPN